MSFIRVMSALSSPGDCPWRAGATESKDKPATHHLRAWTHARAEIEQALPELLRLMQLVRVEREHEAMLDGPELDEPLAAGSRQILGLPKRRVRGLALPSMRGDDRQRKRRRN